MAAEANNWGDSYGGGNRRVAVDSKSTLKLSNNPRKAPSDEIHVRRRYFSLLSLCHNDCNILTKKVTSEENIAEKITKSLYKPRLFYLMKPIGHPVKKGMLGRFYTFIYSSSMSFYVSCTNYSNIFYWGNTITFY